MLKSLIRLRNRIAFKFKDNYSYMKSEIKGNFRHYIYCLLSSMLALFFSLITIRGTSSYTPIITQISENNFNYILSLSGLIFYTVIIYIPIILAGINYLNFYIFGYGGIFVISKITFMNMLNQFLVSIWPAIINSFLYILPLTIVNFALICRNLTKIYLFRSYNAKQGRRLLLICELRPIITLTKKYVLYSMLFNIVIWLINVIIFSIIYV
jgi:hypothetical protein